MISQVKLLVICCDVMFDIWDFNISCEMSLRVNGSASNIRADRQQYSSNNKTTFNFRERRRNFLLRQTESDDNKCYTFLLHAGLVALPAMFTSVQKRLLCSLHTTGGGQL